jgi:hypothetical protein
VEGEANGIQAVKTDPEEYLMVSEADKTAAVANAHIEGLAVGKAHGIRHVEDNPAEFGFFPEAEVVASENVARDQGVSTGATQGKAEGEKEVMVNLGSQGLAAITHHDEVKVRPHTENWYYQPGWGWLWTNENTFPFVYQPTAMFFDYSQEKWVTPPE